MMATRLLLLCLLVLLVASAGQGIDQTDEGRSDQATPDERECSPCTTVVDVLMKAVRSPNITDEQILSKAVNVCYALVTPEGMDPDTLCESTVETYGPHLIYIFQVTPMTPLQICTLYNRCDGLRRAEYPRTLRQEDPTEKYTNRRPPTKWKSNRPKTPDDYPDAVKLVQVTDIHTDAEYAEGSPVQCDMPLCCHSDYNGTGAARHWGDTLCDIPHRTVDLMFDSIAELMSGHTYFLTYTGDSFSHTVWDMPLNEILDTSEYIAERIATYFPNQYAYFAFGNHDACPANLYYAPRMEIKIVNNVLFMEWQPLSGFGPDQQSTFQHAAYYTIETSHPGLRILGYNSCYGYLANFYNILNVEGTDYPDMKQFMEDTLQSARNNSEKVILLGHHPTGTDGYVAEYSRFITDIQSRYSDVIVLHLLGHTHEDSYKLVKDLSTNETRGVQLVCPTMGTYTYLNPSFRILYLDKQTYEPLDMDVYHLDLNLDADNPDATTEFVYRATTEYSMPDLSPQSYNDLTDRMEVDRDLMDLYLWNQETRYSPEEPQCDDVCAQEQLCLLRYTDYERYTECMNSIQSTDDIHVVIIDGHIIEAFREGASRGDLTCWSFKGIFARNSSINRPDV